VSEYDVVVVGGGLAGVAAAAAAARAGKRVALVEKTILFGGLATAGLVPIYMCLCDGRGRKVTAGIAEELLAAAVKYGPGRVPPQWAGALPATLQWDAGYSCHRLYPEAHLDERYMTIFSPVAFALALDELLETAGVALWLDTLACAPLMDKNVVRGVEVQNKSGGVSITAEVVVDATGDADIAFRAGAPCVEQGSYPTYLYQYISRGRLDEVIRTEARLQTQSPAGDPAAAMADSPHGQGSVETSSVTATARPGICTVSPPAGR
jgi:flavin-dependent dehydrogenase